jgi:CRISPR/Cas system-associated protein endoribonuclease Cas2
MSRIPHKPPATLEERQDVLIYCVKCISKKANRLSRLMSPDMDADDIRSEVRIRVWRAMVKKEYLKKTKADLIKIGYVTAQRHISQLLRSRLSVKEKIAIRVPFHAPSVGATVSLIVGKSFFEMSATRIVILTESVRNEAIRLVGIGYYESLIRGTKYAWENEDLCNRQCNILCDLDYSIDRMKRVVDILGKRVAHKIHFSDDYDTAAIRVDGMWVQNTEAARFALA